MLKAWARLWRRHLVFTVLRLTPFYRSRRSPSRRQALKGGLVHPEQRFSEWAITHQSLVLFMIPLLGAAGAYSYFNGF